VKRLVRLVSGLIRKFSIIVLACFLAFSLWLLFLQLKLCPSLREEHGDPRLWVLEKRVLRGGIYTREGENVATSLRQGETVVRCYPYGDLYCHILGYHSRRLGKWGLEGEYDAYLLGLKGDFRSSLLLRSGSSDLHGHNLYLTIDHQLQELAGQLLASYQGAAVVLNPKTGEILALVSTPGFDPNPEYLEKNWEQIRNDSRHPLLNRATLGLYPPGSVFKIVTAALGIERFPGLAGEVFSCRGEIVVAGRTLRDLRPHGKVDLKEALAVSCNSYFASLGLRLGAERFSSGLRVFGWGEELPFELPTAKVPLPEKSLTSANALAEAAVGQGKILVTPLFMALVTAALGNNGVMMEPFLVQEIRSSRNEVLWKRSPRVWRRVCSPEVAAQVKEAMVEVVNSGTGTAASLPGIQVAGKTGSAENPRGRPHAWFVAFAPAENPSVAVSVIIENGGEGGKVAAPIARKLIALALSEEGKE
jgi:peptidoglycan glycosyltransferase